ncbi:unnamed protein product [Parajaminaea phylloscopi]
MPISRSPIISLAAAFFGTVFIGFGVNYILRPYDAFGTFGLPYVSNAADQTIIDSFCKLFGVKDLFMGFSIFTALFFGSRKTLGALLIASSAAAFADGAIVKAHAGTGEWNHWGYGSMVGVVGLLAFGVLG